jgi:intracellular septation protein A
MIEYYKHILEILLIVVFFVFYAVRHLRNDVAFLSRAMSKILSMELTVAENGGLAEDIASANPAATIAAHNETVAECKAEAIMAETEHIQLLVSNLEKVHGLDILKRFKNTFVELSDPMGTPAPHMLTIWDLNIPSLSKEEWVSAEHYGQMFWVDDRILYVNIPILYSGTLVLKIESNYVSMEYYAAPRLHAPSTTDTQRACDYLQSCLNGLATHHTFTTANGFEEFSFEYIVLKSVYDRFIDNDFLLEFSKSTPDRYLFNPMAFGQAMAEGAFTVDEFRAADIHGFFTIHESIEDGVSTFEVDLAHRTFAHWRGSFATSSTKSVHDTPYIFNRIPLLEFMFYWFQLGVVVRTMFVRKHPELAIKLHDNIWSKHD